MNTPLQRLRNWLPANGQPDNDIASPDALRQWIGTLDDAAPLDRAAAMSSRLLPLVSGQHNLHMRTRLLDVFEEAAHKVLPALEDEIRNAPVPLTPQVKAQALTADNLLKALIKGYLSVVSGIDGGALPPPLLQHVILRAMYALRRRQMLAYRAYATPSASSWRQLHELHGVARSCGMSKVSKNSLSIEHIYIVSLLLAYANPSKFPRADLDALCACADRMSSLVSLAETGDVAGSEAPAHLFLVRTDEGHPGAPFLRTPTASSPPHGLIVDCDEVVAALVEEIALRADQDAACAAMLPQIAVPMLETLLQMWGSQPTRRFARTRFKPRVDLVSSLPDVMQLIAGEALRRRRDDARNPHERPAPPISEWAVIDESPDGFGIRYLKGPMRRLEVGEVIGLRSREHSRTHLCLVRRASNTGQARFEIGLQDLSPDAQIVPLPHLEHASQRKALLLPQLPAYGGATGIIAMPGDLPAGLELTYRPAGIPIHLRLGRPVELNSRLEFYLLDEIEIN